MKPPVDAPGSSVDQETLAAVESAQTRWRSELADLGGRNALLWHRDLSTGTLDLTVAHPGGVAKLLAGHNTLLSELFRESVARGEARRRVTAIRTKSVELQREYGLNTLFLAVGMASWHLPRVPIPPRAPVLLRGARIRPTDATRQDYVLWLDSDVVFNPALEHYLRDEQGLDLDGHALARASSGRHGFDPRPTYDALEQLCTGVPQFGIGPQLVLSTYPLAKLPLVAEVSGMLDRLVRSRLVVSLATGAALEMQSATVSAEPTGGSDTEGVRGGTVLDADRSQRDVLALLAGGSSAVLDAEPGTGRTQTIVNALARAFENGDSVLVAAEHRRALDDVHERMRSIGLGELVLDIRETPAAARRVGAELVDALDRHHAGARATNSEFIDAGADDPTADSTAILDTAAIDTAAIDTGAADSQDEDAAAAPPLTGDPLAVLQQHEWHLHGRREPWGVSLAQAQDVLTRLAGLPRPPASHVRLEPDVLDALTPERMGEVRDALTRAVSAGAWKRRSEDPWFGAQITSSQDAERAASVVADLVAGGLTGAREEVNRLCAAAGLPAPVSLHQWSRTFDLLRRVRDTLDVFTPQIYEAPLEELVQATAKHPKGSTEKLPAMARSRLRRQARSLLRPGTPPPNLADRLTHALEERSEWESLAGRAARPSAPRGWEEAAQEYAEIRRDLSWLAEVLATTAQGKDVETTHLDLLLERLLRLDARADRLPVVAAVHADLQPLRDRGLGGLVDDLAHRGVAAEDVEAEADLAFWASVHDQITTQEEQATSGQLRRALDDVEAQGQSAMEAARSAVLTAARERVDSVLARHPEQEDSLRSVVDSGPPLRLFDLLGAAPDLVRALRPCWLVSPLAIPATVPAGLSVDLLVLDEAHRIPLAHVVPALVRAEQVLIVGDSGGLPPVPLTTVADERAQGSAEVSDPLMTVASTVLPIARLENNYRSLDQRMLPGREGSSVAGFPGVLRVSRVRAHQADSREELVNAVVATVLDHARRTPHHSLGVVADDAEVVAEVEQALRAGVAGAQDLLGSFREDVSEPFLLSTVELAAGDVRDRMLVLLTGRPDLDAAWSATALGAARRSVVVFTDRPISELPASSGVDLVRQTLASAASAPERAVHPPTGGTATAVPVGSGDDATSSGPALISDLATRLCAEDLTVRADFGHGPHRIELVVDDPDEPGRPLLAIDTDAHPDADALDADHLRTRSIHLRRLGWTPVRVWTTDIFRDPAQEVARIVEAARHASQERGR